MAAACDNCGYDLRGLSVSVLNCPECGTRIGAGNRQWPCAKWKLGAVGCGPTLTLLLVVLLQRADRNFSVSSEVLHAEQLILPISAMLVPVAIGAALVLGTRVRFSETFHFAVLCVLINAGALIFGVVVAMAEMVGKG